MKSYNHLFEIALSDEIINSSLINASKGKRKRFEVLRLLENKEKYIKKFKEWLIKGEYIPAEHKAVLINDGFIQKKRVVIQPFFYPEQWAQHVVINTLKHIFMKGMYEYSCGSIPGRGIHYGKKYIEKFIKNNPKEIKYVLKFDIYHFYQSINIDLLKEKFKKTIHDERMLRLIFYVLDSNIATLDGENITEGLPIGFYTSQWFANWFLQDFDHFVKEELKAKCYVRYMDDIVIFGRNKKELHKMFFLITEYLAKLDLKIKGNYQVFRFDYIDRQGNRKGRFIDFMGFKFYRDKTTIRSSIFLRAIRKAKRLNKKEKLTWYDACQMISYAGWFYPTDTHNAYKKYIESNISIKLCKKLVSNHFKKKE